MSKKMSSNKNGSRFTTKAYKTFFHLNIVSKNKVQLNIHQFLHLRRSNLKFSVNKLSLNRNYGSIKLVKS